MRERGRGDGWTDGWMDVGEEAVKRSKAWWEVGGAGEVDGGRW